MNFYGYRMIVKMSFLRRQESKNIGTKLRLNYLQIEKYQITTWIPAFAGMTSGRITF